MRFTVRPGTDPVAVADGTLLRMLGLPSGGIMRVGPTHVRVRPATVAGTDLLLGPEATANAAAQVGTIIDVARAMLPDAVSVDIDRDDVAPRDLIHALQGRPVTAGDHVTVDSAYRSDDGATVTVAVVTVDPAPGAIVRGTTRIRLPGHGDGTAEPDNRRMPEAPTTASALLAGLETEQDVLTGWFSLLADRKDLAGRWGLPSVAGVIVEGPAGCGRSEIVHAAARTAGIAVRAVPVNAVFKPERLLDRLSTAVNEAVAPAVLLLDHIDALIGDDGLSTFRTQYLAVLRWFLEAVAERQGIACVLGVDSAAALDAGVRRSPLLPRTLSIPPPDLERRRLLFEAALARVPTLEIDTERLAAQSAGFSGADIVAAVLHASATVAGSGDPLGHDQALAAVQATSPSLGSVPMGQVTGIGFDMVANLTEVKQRLTEGVIWPLENPDRFTRLGIEPPRGILLHGPPGTGKTFVIKALAHEAGAAFFAVKGAELLDKYVGESERAVRDVFARARAAAPSIIFFDEFDALAPTRGRSNTTVSDSVVAALLTELDGVTDRGAVAVVAATNRRDLIDPALLRPGRFETHIHLGLPGAEARLALLKITDVPLAESIDRRELAEATDGLSFADLSGLLRDAALRALRSDEDASVVTGQHVDAALDGVRERLDAGTDTSPDPR